MAVVKDSSKKEKNQETAGCLSQKIREDITFGGVQGHHIKKLSRQWDSSPGCLLNLSELALAATSLMLRGFWHLSGFAKFDVFFAKSCTKTNTIFGVSDCEAAAIASLFQINSRSKYLGKSREKFVTLRFCRLKRTIFTEVCKHSFSAVRHQMWGRRAFEEAAKRAKQRMAQHVEKDERELAERMKNVVTAPRTKMEKTA